MAIRMALGASPRRLMQHVLTEGFLLALMGCAAGMAVCAAAYKLATYIHMNAPLPVTFDLGFDWQVLAYAAIATMVAGLAVGFGPALRTSRIDPEEALREGSRTVTGNRSTLRRILVTAQVAGSVVLLILAGLFTRGLLAAQKIDVGFHPGHILIVPLDPHEAGFDREQSRQFFNGLVPRVRALPGVLSASLAYTYPSNGMVLEFRKVQVGSRPLQHGRSLPTIALDSVSPAYFRTLGIPIVGGRSFLATDTAATPRVAVINQTMAGRYWPHQDPLGTTFSISSSALGPWTHLQVVGIAKDSKYATLQAHGVPYLYLPAAQSNPSSMTLLVKTAGRPELMIHPLETQVHRLARGLPLVGVQTMRQALARSYYGVLSVGADLAAGLGFLGVLLAGIGVFGMIAHDMTRRTREIGVRLALGARSRDIMGMAFRYGLKLVAIGTLIGVFLALLLSGLIAHILYGVSPYDPFTYLAVVLVMLAATLVACYLPARRSTRVDPVQALSCE